MATVTATTTIKFADTLDITLLTPEQIAKFTDKDFAAFSTQQQADLTAAQFTLLTAKQIAALPLKFVEPITVTGIAPKVLSTLDLKSFSADQFAELTPEQIKALTPIQITGLSTAQVDVLTPEQTAVLTSTQVAAFTDKSLKVLSEFALEGITPDAIKGLTPANIIGLTTDSIKILTVEQAAALNAEQIRALTPALVAAMEPEDLAVLTVDAVKGFNVKAIPSLEITALLPEQLAVLTPKQMSTFTATQLGLLDETYAPVFNARVLALLSTAQVNAISTAIVNTLDPLAVKGFTVKNIKGLSTDQLAAITPEQGVNLSKSQLGSLDAAKVSALPVEVIIELKPQVLKSLPVNIIANLSAEAFGAFTDVQIAGLGSKQIAGLTTAQAASLTSEHIQKFTPTAFKNLSNASISALSADALAGLTSKQIVGLSATQLEKMTPAQVAQFAQELKDWAVTTKRYATIESAETDVTVAQGIETGGTVTATARAETITSGAGADTITYTGTPTAGDKITTGAGDDLITVNDAVHTIDGGTGNDTLTFDDATPTLTNVTGIEKIVLANTAAQSFDAGNGANNALTLLTATAIADDAALTLTGSVANLPVSLTNGNLAATGYTAKLVVTATGTNAKTIVTGTGNDSITTGNGANSVEGGTGNDTIVAGTGDDTIKGQAGIDSMTGGSGADVFVIAASDNGAAPSATVFDTITDFGTGNDVLDFGSTLSIQAQSSAATTSIAQISQAGKATFHANTTSLADRITAVEGGINAGTNTAGEAALFTHGSDAYIFISDGSSGVGSADVLIKLEGDATTSKALVIDSTGSNVGNLTSVTGYAATADFSSVLADSVVHVADTAAAISTALSTPGSNLLVGIAAGKIDSITASDSLPIVLAPSKFAQTGVAALLDTGSVNIGGATMSANPSAGYTSELTALNTYAGKIADDGVLSAVTGLTLNVAQFDTLVSKLASSTTVTIDATGATTTQLATISSNIGNITSSGITNLSIPAVDSTVTDSVVHTLLGKATAANVVITGASATEIASLITYKANIASGGAAVGITGTVPALTATQFKDLGSKIADSTTAAVTLTATEGADATTVSAIVTDIANISGITSATSAKIALTDTQFAALGTDFSKLAATMANVNATGATATELAAIATGAAKVNSITGLTLNLTDVTAANTTTLLAKAVSASVVATGGDATQIGHLVTNKANIVSDGITGTIGVTASQFDSLKTNLNTSATVTVTVSSATTADEKTAILGNLTKVDTLAGTGLTLTAAQFNTSGLAAKLSASGVSVVVDASNAAASDLKALSAAITSTPNAISTITGLTLSLGTDYDNTGGTHASAANDTITSNLLSKADGATVDAQNETAAELAALSTYAQNISTVSNSANTVSATEFVANYANLPSGVVVDAASATADQLRVIINNIGHVGSIKNLALNTQDQSDTDLSALLAKAQNSDVTINATYGVDADFSVMVTYAAKIKAGGITGTGLVMKAADFSTLGAKISNSISDMTIDAGTGTPTQATLAGVSNYISKVALVKDLTIDLGDANITNTVAENLLSRSAIASGDAATVTVTGATSTELNSVAAHIDNVTSSGITGVLSLDKNVTASNITALFSKHPTATTAVADISGMSQAQVAAVVAVPTKTAASGITGSVTDMNAATLSALAPSTKLGALTGVLALNSDVSATYIGNLHTAYTGTSATAVITGMSGAQIAALDTTDIATGGITGSVTGLDATALNNLAALSADIADSSLTGNLAIDGSVTQTTSATSGNVSTLFTKYAGTTATFDASGISTHAAADVYRLVAVSNGAAKIQASGITGLSASNFFLGDSGITGTVTANLLGKAAAASVIVDATSADATEIAALSDHYNTISDSTGITGTTSTLVFTDTEFGRLYGKLASGKTVTIDAEGASNAELTTIATQSAKVTALGLTNLTVSTSQTPAQITALLTLAPANAAKINATGMDDLDLAAVSALASTKVAAAGITGAMAVTANSGSNTEIAALFAKYSGTTATADITGMSDTQITALVNDSISSGGITGSVTGLSAAAMTALATKATDITDASLTGTAATLPVAVFSALSAKLAPAVTPLMMTVDFGGATGSLTLTDAQNDAVSFSNAAAGTQTITISDASTSITSNAVIEDYVLAGAGANTITLTAAGQIVTTAVSATNQTVNTGALTSFTGTVTGNSTATDILNISTTGTTISSAVTTTVDRITLGSGVSATMTPAQAALIYSATGSNTVTIATAATALALHADVESYSLFEGTTATLGTSAGNLAQIVTETQSAAVVSTFTLGAGIYTGDWVGIDATDVIKVVNGTNVAGNTGLDTGVTVDFQSATATVTLNATQNGVVTFTNAASNTQTVTVSAADTFTANSAIETYNIVGASIITALAGTNVTGEDATNQTVTVSGLTATGTYALGTGTDVILAASDANISGVNAGAATTAETLDITTVATINVTMTAAQYNGFAAINADAGNDTITLTTAGTISTDNDVGTYSVTAGSVVTVGAAATYAAQILTETGTGVTTFTLGTGAYTGVWTSIETNDVVKVVTGTDVSANTGLNGGVVIDFQSATANVTLNATQNGIVTFTNAAAGTQTVTLSAVDTFTTNAVIDAYSLVGGGTVTLSTAAASDSTTTNITADNTAATTINVGGKTMGAATYALADTADIITTTNGASLSAINAGAATTAEILQASGTVTMTAAQLTGFTGITSTAANITLAGAVTAAVLDGAVVTGDTTFTLANAANTITLGADTIAANTVTLTFDGSASASALTFTGTTEADALLVVTGGSAADTIIGNAVAGTVTGGAGADTIDGAAGADTYVYGSTVTDSNISTTAAAAAGYDSVTVTNGDTFDFSAAVAVVTASTVASGVALDTSTGTLLIGQLNTAFTGNDDGSANIEAMVISFTGTERFLVVDTNSDQAITAADNIIELTGVVTGLTSVSGNVAVTI